MGGLAELISLAREYKKQLKQAKADGRYRRRLDNIAKRVLIILDDFALAPLTDEQRRDFLEIVEQPNDAKSTLIVSQLSYITGMTSRPL